MRTKWPSVSAKAAILVGRPARCASANSSRNAYATLTKPTTIAIWPSCAPPAGAAANIRGTVAYIRHRRLIYVTEDTRPTHADRGPPRAGARRGAADHLRARLQRRQHGGDRARDRGGEDRRLRRVRDPRAAPAVAVGARGAPHPRHAGGARRRGSARMGR